MPLFGKHNKDKDASGHGRHGDKYDARREDDLAPSAGGAGYDQPNVGGPGGPNGGYGNEYSNQQGLDHGNHRGAGPAPTAGSYGGTNDPIVPPATHINTNSDATHSGSTGGRLAGKAERAVGSLVGSQALKEKGLQKEQEAGVFKMQSAEIAEAERLEKEALMRRERAVAHGAHPDNRHLGGLQNANTLSDVTAQGGDQFRTY